MVPFPDPPADFGIVGGVVPPGRQRGQFHRLLVVGREEVQSVGFISSRRLGIEGDKAAMLPDHLRDSRDQAGRQEALGVIGQNHPVTFRDLLLQSAPRLFRGEGRAVTRGILLGVDAAKLLVAHDHPCLGDGGSGLEESAVKHDAPAGQMREQFPAAEVAADRADDFDGGAERSRIGGDVRGAAGRVRFPVLLDHRHGRLGGNARGVAPDVVVEHHVADHEDAETGDLPEQLADMGGRDGGHQRISQS